jgi:flagellar hook-length control protein FliK
VAEEPTATQPVAQVPAAMPQPAEPAAPQAVASEPVVGVATVEEQTATVETAATEPTTAAGVATEEATPTSVVGRAPVADSSTTRPGDSRAQGGSGSGDEARPSVAAPVNPAAVANDGGRSGAGSQSDQRQSDRQDAPHVTAQGTQSTPQVQTQRVDAAPLSGQVHVPAPGGEPRGAATLAQAPRAVGQLIHLASERGVQHARLNLRPVELGGIEIRLVASSAGITAHVVADSPEAARLLQQAGEELRRSLAASNVELLSLDVSTSDQERRDASAAAGGFEQFGDSGPRGRDGLGRPQRAGQTDTDLPISTDRGTVIELPDGVLVDVLA